MDKAKLEALFDGALKPHGFRKKGSTWYRHAQDVLQGVNVQKSSYGGQFYLNLFFVPDGILVDGMPTPKEHKCPIRIRLTAAMPKRQKEIEALLNLESDSLSDSQRTSAVHEIIVRTLSDFLDPLQTVDDLRLAVKNDVFKSGAVNLVAQKYFGLEVGSSPTK